MYATVASESWGISPSNKGKWFSSWDKLAAVNSNSVSWSRASNTETIRQGFISVLQTSQYYSPTSAASSTARINWEDVPFILDFCAGVDGEPVTVIEAGLGEVLTMISPIEEPFLYAICC